MKYLLPLLCSAAVFLAARHLPGVITPSPDPAKTAEDRPREPSKGLARRVELLVARAQPSASSAERLYRSGKLSPEDLDDYIARLAASDPEGAWNWVSNADLPGSKKADLRKLIAGAWFPKDPEKVLSLLSGCDYFECVQTSGWLIGKLGSGSPEEAAAVRAHLDSLVSLNAGVSNLIFISPVGTAGGDILLSLPEGRSRELLLSRFAALWLSQDPAAAEAWMNRLAPALKSRAMEEFATQALLGDPDSNEASRKLALNWIEKEASPALRAALGPQVAAILSKEDPATAMEWASSHLASAALAAATRDIIAEVIKSDAGKARQMVEDLPPGSLRHQAAFKVAESWISSEPAAAVSWWFGQIDKDEASQSGNYSPGGRLGESWIKSNPESFRSYVADPVSRDLPYATVSTAVDRMMAKDRNGTLDWISSLPKERRGDVIRAAYQSMAYKAPSEAAATFDSRPDLATGDAARQIASGWYARDPDAAVDWISTLPWGGPREAALAAVKQQADFNVQLGGTFPQDLKNLLH